MTTLTDEDMDPFTIDGHTAADLSHEPEDGLGRELHDGVIYVVPPPSNKHQWAESALERALLRRCPEDAYVFSRVRSAHRRQPLVCAGRDGR